MHEIGLAIAKNMFIFIGNSKHLRQMRCNTSSVIKGRRVSRRNTKKAWIGEDRNETDEDPNGSQIIGLDKRHIFTFFLYTAI